MSTWFLYFIEEMYPDLNIKSVLKHDFGEALSKILFLHFMKQEPWTMSLEDQSLHINVVAS